MPRPTDIEEIRNRSVAMLPGDGHAEEHAVEQTVPSKGLIHGRMERARKAHRDIDERMNQSAEGPHDDEEGPNRVYNQKEAAPHLGRQSYPKGLPSPFKMRIQTLEDAQEETRQERALWEKEEAKRRIATLSQELKYLKAVHGDPDEEL